MSGRRSNAIDELVGRNIRLFRLERNMSQTELAQKIGVTFQQVQKYESGANRVGAGRLFKVATIFGVPVNALFDGADDQLIDGSAQSPAALLADPHALRLLQAFSAIQDKALRARIVELAEILGAHSAEKTAVQMSGDSQMHLPDLPPSHSS